MPHSAIDDIYLCQVSDTVSCGACCGLYNVPDSSFPALRSILASRTRVFGDLSRNIEAILAFGEKEISLLGQPPLEDFHHCPYLGLIGPERSRVGCLLHPMAEGNHGIDYRGLSYYGSMTCQMYFCPTHRRTPRYLKILLRDVIEDWHTFGLVAPEADLLAAMDEQIKGRLSVGDIDPETALRDDNRSLWQTLLTLKRDWPFRAEGRPLANYFFNDGLNKKPPVDYERTGKTGSRYDRLFRELHTVLETPEALSRAEAFLDRLFEELAGSL